VKTASLYDNFCKTGNYVIYDVIIWVQDGNCKKWLERILVLVCSTYVNICPSLIEIGSRRLRKTLHKQTDTKRIMVTWPWTNTYQFCQSGQQIQQYQRSSASNSLDSLSALHIKQQKTSAAENSDIKIKRQTNQHQLHFNGCFQLNLGYLVPPWAFFLYLF